MLVMGSAQIRHRYTYDHSREGEKKPREDGKSRAKGEGIIRCPVERSSVERDINVVQSQDVSESGCLSVGGVGSEMLRMKRRPYLKDHGNSRIGW